MFSINCATTQSESDNATTTTTQYDALGRPVSVSYDDGITPTKSFLYDVSANWSITQNNVKGRLSVEQVSPPTITAGTAYSYTAMGYIAQTASCVPSGCGTASRDKQTPYTWDWLGNMLTSGDGAGVTTTYSYSVANELQSIASSYEPSIVSNVQNGPFGPISYTLGNGANTLLAYDSLGRQNERFVCLNSTQLHCTGGTQLYGFILGYQGMRVTDVSDSAINQHRTYGYDEFNRLTSMKSYDTGQQLYSYVYDRYGNRWQQNALQGGSSFSASFDPTSNKINSGGYVYDAAGNMTADGSCSYTYDAEGNIVTQVCGGNTRTYSFDALNQLVRYDWGSSGEEYVRNLNGQRVSIWVPGTNTKTQRQTYWGSTPVMFSASSAAHYQHQDWLGTERARTTSTGSVEATFTSLPFGDGYSASGPDNDHYHFAQLDHDATSSTEQAQFRRYASLQGHWLSPDPYPGSYDFSNPQSS